MAHLRKKDAIRFVQNEIKVIADSYIEHTKIRSQAVKTAIWYLGLNLPYDFISEQLGLSLSHVKKIRSTHKPIIERLQQDTVELYKQFNLHEELV